MTLALTTMSLLLLEVVLLASDTIAQQKSLKEQLVGTWIYVSDHDALQIGAVGFAAIRPGTGA